MAHSAFAPLWGQTARNFFQPPVSESAPAPAAQTGAPAALHRLIGVVIVADQAVAIFRNPQNGQLKMLRRGEQIDGRRIKRITLNAVSYTKNKP